MGWFGDALRGAYWYGFFPAVVLLAGGSEELVPGAGPPEGAAVPGALVRLDGRVEDGAPVEGVAFYHFLAQVVALPESAWEVPAPPRVGAEELEQSPHRFRGRMVEVVGAVLETSAWELPGNPSGLERVFLVHLLGEGEALLTAVLTEEPGTWRRGDGVRVRGLFFKVWRYRSRGGGWEEAPLLVARRLVSAPAAEVGGRAGEALLGLAVAGGMALVVLLALRLWLGWARRPVHFRLPERGEEDDDSAGSRGPG